MESLLWVVCPRPYLTPDGDEVQLKRRKLVKCRREKDPRPMNQYGETFAGFYDRRFGGYADQAAPLLLRFFSSQPVSKENLKILDLGCGTGRLAERFLESGYVVTGLDLSPAMIALAENRCRRHVAAGKARFLKADIASFHLEESFGLVLSTYNSMNHLDSVEKLKDCFRSAVKCLAPEGWLLFDYHTLGGLREWEASESAQWEGGWVETQGSFDEARGRAVMRLKGSDGQRPFEETVQNQAFPLDRLAALLREGGFGRVEFSTMIDLGTPLQEPEKEPRVVVLARLKED
jgi:SAM-dependent methyltransferase